MFLAVYWLTELAFLLSAAMTIIEWAFLAAKIIKI
jgi:hypothetical protein